MPAVRLLLRATLLTLAVALLVSCGGTPTTIQQTPLATDDTPTVAQPRYTLTFSLDQVTTVDRDSADFSYEAVEFNDENAFVLRFAAQDEALVAYVRLLERLPRGNYQTDSLPEDQPVGVEILDLIGAWLEVDGEIYDDVTYGRLTLEEVTEEMISGTFAFELFFGEDTNEEGVPAFAFSGTFTNLPVPLVPEELEMPDVAPEFTPDPELDDLEQEMLDELEELGIDIEDLQPDDEDE
jgi:hypothetical protein